jgi:hypothetical protein
MHVQPRPSQLHAAIVTQTLIVPPLQHCWPATIIFNVVSPHQRNSFGALANSLAAELCSIDKFRAVIDPSIECSSFVHLILFEHEPNSNLSPN